MAKFNFFKLALIAAILVAFAIATANAECKTSRSVRKDYPYDCREGNSVNGRDLCCEGFSCLCGREASFYGIPHDSCRCLH